MGKELEAKNQTKRVSKNSKKGKKKEKE